ALKGISDEVATRNASERTAGRHPERRARGSVEIAVRGLDHRAKRVRAVGVTEPGKRGQRPIRCHSEDGPITPGGIVGGGLAALCTRAIETSIGCLDQGSFGCVTVRVSGERVELLVSIILGCSTRQRTQERGGKNRRGPENVRGPYRRCI